MSSRTAKQSRDLPQATEGPSQMERDLAEQTSDAIRRSREIVDRSHEILDNFDATWMTLPRPESYTELSEQLRVRDGSTAVRRDLIVIGGSAGSSVPLARIVTRLPENLPAATFIVQHSPKVGWMGQQMVDILRAHTRLSVVLASDLQPFHAGEIYICPPNHHLSIDNALLRVESSPIENHTRPSIDVLFRSAAATFGRRVIAILLSGTLTDGTAGLWQVKKRGGIAIVQDPSEAAFPAMPCNAMENVTVDYALSADRIGDKLSELTMHANAVPDKPAILIVEDESLVAQNLREQLEQIPYEVCGAVASGKDAVWAAEKNNPDLILMDIRLPGQMNGIDAARLIWEQFQIPVVFVTAHADLQTLSEVKTTESYGYVVKPFDIASLRAAVELALDRHEKQTRHISG